MTNNLQKQLGNIDIYLFDQLLKGRFNNCKKIADIGCGGGRNLVYFLQNGFEVFGSDRDPNAIESVRLLSAQLSPATPADNFVVATIEELPFNDATFDLAICSAVLHFARNRQHFEDMLHSCWRVLKSGGYLFVRLASDIGIETLVKPLTEGRYLLPDGSTRYLVNQEMLLEYTQLLKGELFEPIKTTNVSNLRSMTTWCIQKK